MKILVKQLFAVIALTLIMSGCASQKQISYLQGIPDGYSQKIDKSYEMKIQPDDLISIAVTSPDPELSQIFNKPESQGDSESTSNLQGYLVSKDGTISFPYLGEIEVAGMTRSELTDFVKGQLIDKGLIKEPVVGVRFLNFRVSVIGEVAHPGTFNVSGDRITIFDALSQAGDMTIYGQRNNVKIVREENGVRTVSVVDVRGADILNSPYYYLQQNDVVYVEPNKVRAGQREINQNRSISTVASITSVFLSLVAIILL